MSLRETSVGTRRTSDTTVRMPVRRQVAFAAVLMSASTVIVAINAQLLRRAQL